MTCTVGWIKKINMPYIKPDDRMKFDDSINGLVDLLGSSKGVNAGELNYVISSVVWELFRDKYSYSEGNTIIGVLECVKQEFYRRQLAVLEDTKQEENGDL